MSFDKKSIYMSKIRVIFVAYVFFFKTVSTLNQIYF